MRLIVDLILSAEKIVIFTGAGVSTESGIPDFRSAGGIWSKYDPQDFTYQRFLASEPAREKYWQMSTANFVTIFYITATQHYIKSITDSCAI